MASLKDRWREIRPPLVSRALYAIVRGIGMTLRIKSHGVENIPTAAPRIYCGWHGKSLVFENHFRKQGIWVLISTSRDGEIQANLFQRMGYKVIRGSTGREGVRALAQAVSQLKQGGDLAMTPDGPRGPAEVVQPGVIFMAKKSGAALVPTGISAKPCKRIRSWDKHLIPYFFARATICFGEPIYVPADSDEAQEEALRLTLENAIRAQEDRAESLL